MLPIIIIGILYLIIGVAVLVVAAVDEVRNPGSAVPAWVHILCTLIVLILWPVWIVFNFRRTF